MLGSSMQADRAASVNVALDWGLAVGPMAPFVPPVTADLQSLSVTLDSEAVGSLSLEFDAWDTKAQDFTYLTDPRLAVGNRLQVTIGNDAAVETLFFGTVTDHNATVSQSGVSLSITAYDMRHTLRQGRFRRTFKSQSPLDIAQAIIKDRGLSSKVTKALGAPPAAIPARRQTTGSDYEFIIALLDDIGYRMDVEGDTIHIRKPPTKPLNPFEIAYFKPTTMMSFSASQSAAALIDGVIVLAFDRETQTQVVGKAGTTTSLLGTPTVVVMNAAVDTAAQADEIAKNELARRQRNRFSASLKCIGDAALAPGGWVDVAEVGPYSGAYRITRATHTWNPSGGYTTDLALEQDGG